MRRGGGPIASSRFADAVLLSQLLFAVACAGGLAGRTVNRKETRLDGNGVPMFQCRATLRNTGPRAGCRCLVDVLLQRPENRW